MSQTTGNGMEPSVRDGPRVDSRQFSSNLNLKLLSVLVELDRCRNVSRAAERLDLSQSAVSMSLAKLRKHFNDPLFVRTSRGMEPTPGAVQLIGIFGQAEDLLQTAFGRSILFDPRTSERVFRVQATDIGQVILLPKLMQHLREVAPAVRVDLRRIGQDTPRLLESGEVNLAIGCIPPMGAGFCHQRLFQERFVCATRKEHPRIGSRLTLEEFEAGPGGLDGEMTLGLKFLQR